VSLETRHRSACRSMRLADIELQRPGSSVRCTAPQTQLWLAQALAPASTAYNVGLAYDLRGDLDVAALERAVNWTCARHEALRCIICDAYDGVPQLVPHGEAHLPLHIQDSRDRTITADVVQRLVCVPFDLSRGTVRAGLMRLTPHHHILVFAIHHAVFDTWSARVFLDDIAHGYAGDASSADRSPPSFLDYARTQSQTRDDCEDHRFWRTALAGAPPCSRPPVDRPGAEVPAGHAAALTRRMSSDVLHALTNVTKRERVTIFAAVAGATASALAKRCQQDEVVIGIPVNRRVDECWERTIGLFVSALPLRIRVGDVADDAALRRQSFEAIQATLRHARPSLAQIVTWSGVARVPGANPLFQFGLGSEPLDGNRLRLEGVEATEIGVPPAEPRFDVTLSLLLGRREAAWSAELDRRRYSPSLGEGMIHDIEHTLRKAA
jgi:Condensation domain